jgi:predicted nucleic acid-binding protein
MNGINIFLDSNAVIAVLNGNHNAIELTDDRQLFVSFITELELQCYPNASTDKLSRIQALLKLCTIIDINSEIKRLAIQLRIKYGLKLPDAIIAGSCIYLDLPFICR